MMNSTPDPRTQWLKRATAGYLTTLSAVVAVGAIFFADLYQTPTEALRSTVPANHPLNQGYFIFVNACGAVLALSLGTVAGLFGVWRRNTLQGLAALGIGCLLTLFALDLLPWIDYPHDRYSPAAAWGFAMAIPILLIFFATGFIGKKARRQRTA